MMNRADAYGPRIPPRPTSLEETGIDEDLLEELVLKAVANAGTLDAASAAEQLRLPLNGVLDPVLTNLRKNGLLDVATGDAERARYQAMRGWAIGNSLVFRLSERGREQARAAFERNGYVGPAPVPFASYCAALKEQAESRQAVRPETVRQCLSHLVLGREVLDAIGVAVNRGGSLLLSGPPGNGKTAIAEAIASMLDENVLIPHAIEVSGHVLPIFDAKMHVPLSLASEDKNARLDERWVLCQPPLVRAGGELVLESLDLQFHDRLHLYECPLQMKAAGGVLLIDDFGRQRARPEELLNRWIVPLERGEDYVTLMHGQQAAMPFTALVVFSTNLRASVLLDEAFLRRVPNKVWIGDPTPEQFREILQRTCQAMGVPYSEQGWAYLWRQHYQQTARPIRGCQPRDLLKHILALSDYYGLAPELSPVMIDAASHLYFLAGEEVGNTPAAAQRAPQPRRG